MIFPTYSTYKPLRALRLCVKSEKVSGNWNGIGKTHSRIIGRSGARCTRAAPGAWRPNGRAGARPSPRTMPYFTACGRVATCYDRARRFPRIYA